MKEVIIMKKSLLLLFTTFLLAGCSNSSKGGSTPSGGGQGGGTGEVVKFSADFSIGNPTGNTDSSSYSSLVLGYFGEGLASYVTGITFSGYSQIKENERQASEGASKVKDYRLSIGSKNQGDCVMTFSFAKGLKEIEFCTECWWSGYTVQNVYTKTIVENYVAVSVNEEAYVLRDVANGNNGGFELVNRKYTFSTPLTSLSISGNGRVCFSTMALTFVK